MTSAGSAGAFFRPILATVGALVSVLMIYAGGRPGPLLTSLQGTSVSAVILFVLLTVGGLWVLRTSTASAWRWAAGVGVILATAQLAGMSLRAFDALVDPLLDATNLAWVAVHWLGIVWMVTCGLAALIGALDTNRLHPALDVRSEGVGRPRPFVRLVASLQAPDTSRRRASLLTVLGILVLSRVPYLIVYWPGIVFFDSFRSYAFARGTSPWQTYEPVGQSLLIAVTQWLGTALGWGDAGGVAISSITGILVSSAAFTFMLSRMAAWGLHPGLWAATFAWVAVLPVFGYFSVELVKDVPFSIAMTVLLVCIGELSFGSPDTAGKLWPWMTMTVTAIVALVTRNNGVHVLALSLPLLLVPLRRRWKRILVVLAALVAVYGIYVGPVYAMLNVQPGPKEEAYSVPIQQLARIAKYQSAALSTADRVFITRTFAGMPPAELGKHYVPGLADPMKLQARKAWANHSTIEFLAGWAKIAAKHPATAIEATLANTVGYWDPEGSSYDGLARWSVNDIRGIHLDIPSGPPTAGISAEIEASGIMPTRTYREGLHDDGYRAIPVLGLAMSPGPVCWLWLIAAVLVVRRRDRPALAIFVLPGILLLSALAGPVSGGQRYSLALFMALPLAVAAVALPTRSRSALPSSADSHSPAVQDHSPAVQGHSPAVQGQRPEGSDVE